MSKECEVIKITSLDDNIKKIYEDSKEKYNQILSRKQHIEIKILYLLQAVAILGGLNALQTASGDNQPKYFDIWIKHCNISSYVLLGLSVMVLVQALNDNLLHKKIIRRIVSALYKIDVEKYGYENKESPFADKMLEEYKKCKNRKKYSGLDEYYEEIINATNRATRLAFNVSVAKNICFTTGLYLFVLTVILRTISVFLNSI
ncbi:hypothetical protein [Clostridium beijerinckii]|uniref:SMODS and SLOG-associating 2TM effector domain-containing protein n=2 Tax=Clostridium beijerinckii TaxID=1520 RepID=A0A9Q5CLE3_CLOBE|nr:hypothetical protein [Clostridium beijerinckii]AQS04802.1 hypothetical protein CLBIJ_22320 [Clostridium beijerinckii]MBA2887521.1 hypothetical protein [Clostridium beijerinckii]MBA2902411.1 hypothetical protein [Clostridium beijerinckii]MBA2912299.1 hypothetical protein [Clostridium beijerinckii]MBA9015639.1 hypothetical protein [Clostridium beijerinckii]